MKKVYYNLLYIFIAFFALVFLDSTSVDALSYFQMCNDGNISAKNAMYYNCGDDPVFLYGEEEEKSSNFVSSLKINSGLNIIYAGKIDGMDTFYSLGFYYYGVVYDDRGLTTSKQNYWSDLSVNGVVVYDGKFTDNALVDQSKTDPVTFYNEKGTHLIRQYINNQVVKAIKVIVVEEKDSDLFIESAKLGEKNINDVSLFKQGEDLTFTITGGKYGFGSTAVVKFNDCKIVEDFRKKLVVSYSKFKNCAIENEDNSISLSLINGLGVEKTFKYSFGLKSNKVSIKLENTVSQTVTTSRRIVINATAGVGKKLNEEYSLYYWSKNPDDELEFGSFMTNYEESDYRGSYTNDRGVILRDCEGSYYLYALARDNDSIVVVRSDEYILERGKDINSIILKDAVIVGALILLAVVPILIYLHVRGKDTA